MNPPIEVEVAMPIDVFLMVLGAALVHALWNALIKTDGNRLGLIKLMSLTQLCLSLCLLPFVAVPAADSWPYLAASMLFSTAYMLSLNQAYAEGDLSLVYPLARGATPVLVAIISIFVLGEQLSRISQLAILLIGAGITSLALTHGIGINSRRPVLLALRTGAFIAGYTIFDSLGARASGNVHGYMVWLSLLTSILIVALAHGMQRDLQPASGTPISTRSRRAGIASGLLSYGSSWVVIWALTLAPMALVSALRETGVVFAVIIGVVILKEPVNLSRLASIMTTMVGTAVLKLNR
jgi:drug/metabolite transporter (DMT)-like permease